MAKDGTDMDLSPLDWKHGSDGTDDYKGSFILTF